jgi:hypothetical protein
MRPVLRARLEIETARYLEADLRRLLQALQNFGQVVPFSILLPAFASFHSAPHIFCRSRVAS